MSTCIITVIIRVTNLYVSIYRIHVLIHVCRVLIVFNQREVILTNANWYLKPLNLLGGCKCNMPYCKFCIYTPSKFEIYNMTQNLCLHAIMLCSYGNYVDSIVEYRLKSAVLLSKYPQHHQHTAYVPTKSWNHFARTLIFKKDNSSRA